MAPSDVCPTEDAVKAFLEQLVDPMLPAKSSIRDNPTPSQQHSVAKQVHSVVLLYNYYHRKHHPELEFLKFGEFCKLAVVLKPTLLTHMKYMQKSDKPELVDVEKQLSLTEKKIMDACDISTCLDASKNVPNVERWPISKVAVLLIDGKKENCVLLFSSITEGVWSVVEKDVDTPSQNSEVAGGTTRFTYKKRRVIKKPTKDESNVDEAGFLQVGYSAVKEAAGIDKTGIILLESCTVYSHSKEKAASRFYIMKCSQFSEEVKRVPIKDLIESLQGPLVKKSSRNWTVTPVVEYFHVLPYSEIISDWISRETFSNSLQDSKLAEKNIMADSSEVKESHVSNKGMSVGLVNKPSSDNIESLNLKQKENTGSCIVIQSDSINEAQHMNVDNSNSLQDSKLAEKHIMADSPEVKVSHVSNKGMFVGLANKPSSENIESLSLKQKENTGSCIVIQSDSINEAQDMNVDNSNSLQDSKVAEKNIMADSPEVKESHVSNKGMFVGLANKPSNDNIESLSLKQKDNTGSCIVIQSDSINEEDMNVDNSTLFPSQIKEECRHIANTSQVSEDQEIKNTSVQHYSNGSTSLIKAGKDELTKLLVIEGRIENQSACNQIRANTSSKKNAGDKYALIAKNSKSDLEKLQVLLASKGETLSQTALTALIRKRNELALQQRMIEDEIALCDLKIQRILAGGDDDLELKIDSIIEGCNDLWVRDQQRIYRHLEDQSSPPCFKRKRLTEAVLTMHSPCQELDSICYENNWILPTYRVSQSDGGFQVNVTVKGLDFECSHQGNLCSYPREARESAAAVMLANLRSMAKSDSDY